MILELGLFFLYASSVPYQVYLVGIWFGKKMEPLPLLEIYPPISVVISAYNEEKNLEERFKNLVATGYTNMEIVFVDDCSTDNTAIIAKYYLDKYYQSNYTFIHNEIQMGTSASYNKAIAATKYELVVVTDADVLFKPDALTKLIARLMSSTNIGAVTGDLQPSPSEDLTVHLESQYRSLYWQMCDWESANDSTANFNGGLMAFRKRAVLHINSTRGADDVNIAFAAIQNGYRAVYEKEAVVYESIPKLFETQYKQKVRRATLLINSFLANDVLLGHDRPYTKFFFLRLWMILVSPTAFFLGCILFYPILLLIPLIFLFSFVESFILNQFYLLMGLMNLGKDVQTWESTSSVQEST